MGKRDAVAMQLPFIYIFSVPVYIHQHFLYIVGHWYGRILLTNGKPKLNKHIKRINHLVRVMLGVRLINFTAIIQKKVPSSTLYRVLLVSCSVGTRKGYM